MGVILVPDPNDFFFSVLFEIKEQILTGKFLNLAKSQNFRITNRCIRLRFFRGFLLTYRLLGGEILLNPCSIKQTNQSIPLFKWQTNIAVEEPGVEEKLNGDTIN